MDVESYSRRLLSPFHGMLQVVEVSGGVAERFDGMHWQTSWLLQLADLDPDSRASIERAAWERPLATGKAFHLYPVVLDREGLTATRVKARLMGNLTSTKAPPEPSYP